MHEKWIGALGAIVLLAIAFAFCPGALRKHVRWRAVGLGLLLLFGFAAIVLKTPARALFDGANSAVARMLDFSKQGAGFVFGRLVTDTDSFGFVFAFQVLPTIVFFAAFMSLLYYVGVMPFVIDRCARLLARTLGTSGAESLSTVADIFVGQTEAPLVIRPVHREADALGADGLHDRGLRDDRRRRARGLRADARGVRAGHRRAPDRVQRDVRAGLARDRQADAARDRARRRRSGAAPPASRQQRELGCSTRSPPARATACKLAVNVGAMLISFLALTALLTSCCGWLGEAVLHRPLSLELLLGWLFAPIAWLMGVPAPM